MASVVSFRLANSADLATADLAFTCVARQLGGAAALLGNSDEAAAYLQQALDIASRVQFCPEIALAQLELAELRQLVQTQQEAIARLTEQQDGLQSDAQDQREDLLQRLQHEVRRDW